MLCQTPAGPRQIGLLVFNQKQNFLVSKTLVKDGIEQFGMRTSQFVNRVRLVFLEPFRLVYSFVKPSNLRSLAVEINKSFQFGPVQVLSKKAIL